MTIAQDYRRTHIRIPEPLYKGLDAAVHSAAGMVGSLNGESELLSAAEAVDSLGERWRGLTEGRLASGLQDLRQVFRRRRKGYEEFVPEALAAIREAATRHIGLQPFVVQTAGALALYRGCIAEMATGEGKTLTAALAAVLHGWSGYPAHVVTVNDYLAERDAAWMGPLYRACGVSVGHVSSEMDPAARRAGYAADIAYTTSKEIVADFLRDRLWLGDLQRAERRQLAVLLGKAPAIEPGLVMRGIHAAIVDEADSILVDEAVTPLIIARAGSADAFLEACARAHEIASGLRPREDYKVDRRLRDIHFDDRQRERLADRLRRMPGTYGGSSGELELVQQALSAREFFSKGAEYLVQDGRIVIVDEFTGRQMPQRSWRGGLHQLIEIKEGLEPTAPTETLARLSFQRFFRFFRRLSGMTGTAREASGEFWDIYRLNVVRIPENRPCRRFVGPPRLFSRGEERWKAVLEEIDEVNRSGRPILVGTRSVLASEHLSSLLEGRGLFHRVLNAVRHREEAGILASAGVRGAITIATNMAGRGTDIRLGPGVAEAGGLHVIATECHESARIDRQLFGRCARQGDPGSARAYASLEDELLLRFAPPPLRSLAQAQIEGGLPGAGGWALRFAQFVAQRQAFDRRKAVLKTDTWLDDSLSFAPGDVI